MSIYLDNCDIKEEGATGIAKSFKNYPELNNLDLSLIGNKNLGNGCVPVLKSLFNLDEQKLYKIDLYLTDCGITLEDEAVRDELLKD